MRRVCSISALALLLSLAACGGSDPTSGRLGTIRGTVMLGPTCPVESVQSPCPDVPADGVKVRAVRNGDAVATTVSDRSGRFEMTVDPGAYVVEAVPGPQTPGMFSKPSGVTVSAGEIARVTVVLDTGIRMPSGPSG